MQCRSMLPHTRFQVFLVHVHIFPPIIEALLLESASCRRQPGQLFDDALLHVQHHGKLPNPQL